MQEKNVVTVDSGNATTIVNYDEKASAIFWGSTSIGSNRVTQRPVKRSIRRNNRRRLR